MSVPFFEQQFVSLTNMRTKQISLLVKNAHHNKEKQALETLMFGNWRGMCIDKTPTQTVAPGHAAAKECYELNQEQTGEKQKETKEWLCGGNVVWGECFQTG